MLKFAWSFIVTLIIFSFSNQLYAGFCSLEYRDQFIDFINNIPSINCSNNSSYNKLSYIKLTRFNSPIPSYYYEVATKTYSCATGELTSFSFNPFSTGCYGDMDVSSKTLDIERPLLQCGSIVQTGSQTLGEIIPLVGVNFKLNYFSNRVIGRVSDYIMKIPITAGQIVAPGVTGFNLTIKNDNGDIVQTESFGTSANQTTTYITNGLMASGVEAWASVPYSAEIEELGTEFSYSSIIDARIGNLKNMKLGVGGWVPSNWFYYDIDAGILYKPDGTERVAKAQNLAGGFYLIAEEDGSLAYIFDSTGKIVETKLGLTGAIVNAFYYDSNGRISHIIEPFNKTTIFNRNANGDLVSISAPNGKVTNVVLDINGYLMNLVNQNNETYEMTYYGTGGLLSSFKKPNGVSSAFTYDVDGNLIQDLHLGGDSVQLSKTEDSNGKYISSTSTMGRQSILSFSQSIDFSNIQNIQKNLKAEGSQYIANDQATLFTGRFQKYSQNQSSSETNYILDPRFGNTSEFTKSISSNKFGSRIQNFNDSVTLEYLNDPFSLISWQKTSSVGGDGHYSVTSTYTSSDKTTITTTALGKTTVNQIDDYQRPIMSQQGDLLPIEREYTEDKLTKVTQGNRATKFAYNAANLLSAITNSLGEKTKFAYNSSERLVRKTLPDGREIRYGYDGNGNLKTVTPPSRPTHRLHLNKKELLGAYIPPTVDGIADPMTRYHYNLDNQLVKILRPDGQSITNIYDLASGRLNKVKVPSGQYLYSYDLLSQNISLPTKITAPDNLSVDLAYSYGALNNLTIKDSNGSSIYNYKMISTQDAELNAEEITAGSVFTTNYAYDNDEYLSQAGDLLLTYTTPTGLLDTTTLGNLHDQYNYNNYGELTNYQFRRVNALKYKTVLTRDKLSRVTKKVETINGATATYEYAYDAVGRLIEVKKDSVVVSTYTYDDNSNRIGGNNGTPITATYDDQDRMLTYKDYVFSYNANGDLVSNTNTTTNQTINYNYDVFGNLLEVTLPTKTIMYEIDPMNRRLGKKTNGVLQVRYAYDTGNRLIAEIAPNGTLLKRFVYGSKANIPDYFFDASNEKFRIVSDHLGSVRLVMRESDGAIMQQMEHDEFGRVIVDTNPGYQPFGYAGGLYDPDTALVRFGARDYMPSAGRWTSKDPIRFNAGDTNLFGYTFQDPVNFIDPNGLASLSFLPPNGQSNAGAVVAVAGVVTTAVGAATNNVSLVGAGLVLSYQGATNLIEANQRGGSISLPLLDQFNQFIDNNSGRFSPDRDGGACMAH